MPLINPGKLTEGVYRPPRPKQLPEKAVREFMTIYEKQYGKKISYEKAEEQGVLLLRIVARAMGYKV